MTHRTKLSLFFLSLIIISSAIYTSCSTNVGDSDAPATIEDLDFDPQTNQFTWTATGDDGDSGTATIYDLRFLEDEEVARLLGLSLGEFNAMHPAVDPTVEGVVRNNFEDATQVLDEPEPNEAGTLESFILEELDVEGGKRLFFALTARDEVGNSSSPSNVVEVQTPLVSAAFINSTDGSCFGESIGHGDFDGDGISDVAIGGPCLDAVYIFFGRNDLIAGSNDGEAIFHAGLADMADVTIIGYVGDRFGASVAGVGNIGGDGADDLAIGASDFGGGTGRVFIVFGSPELPVTIDFTIGDQPDRLITGENEGDNFGSSIAVVTGVGGEGKRLLVGAPGANSETGKAYLFGGDDIGVDTPASDAKAIFFGETAGDMFGSALSKGGDFDGDSFSEFAVGAPGAGKVYVFFGQNDISGGTADTVIISGSAADGFGTSLSGGEDINEDGNGTPDLIIGAPGTNSNRGSVFLYSGKDIGSAKASGIPSVFETEFTGESSGGRFGSSVSVFGDINPEIEKQSVEGGFIFSLNLTNADFTVGAPMESDGRGKVYLFFGRNGFSNPVAASQADVTLEGNSASEQFGSALTTVGDITGDSIEDFAIGGVDVVRVEF